MMTESMIERVARALYEKYSIEHPESEWPDGVSSVVKRHFKQVALTAIEAMREPTEAMKIEGADTWEQEHQAVAAVYRGMIDAALEEEDK